jgi:hypothetical protein
MVRVKWTKETIDLLTDEVKNSPENLTKAFHNISKKLGISPGSVSQAWYSKVRKSFPHFATGSDSKVVVNTKNTHRKKRKLVINAKLKNTRSRFLFEKIISEKMIDDIRAVTVTKYYTK